MSRLVHLLTRQIQLSVIATLAEQTTKESQLRMAFDKIDPQELRVHMKAVDEVRVQAAIATLTDIAEVLEGENDACLHL
jgi:hypothetical protein